MKSLLVLCVALLVAGTVSANMAAPKVLQPIGSPGHECSVDNGITFPSRSDGMCYRDDAPKNNQVELQWSQGSDRPGTHSSRTTAPTQTPCERQMEEAMRQMEPFTAMRQATSIDERTGKTVWVSPWPKGMQQVQDQWDAATACWRGR